MGTYRGRDMNVEREIAKFLDKNLYTQAIFSRHERTDNLDIQMQGSDIILSIPSKGIKDAVVDEKALTHYINSNLPTFALELDFLSSRGDVIQGWLLDNTKTTEYYLLQWIWANKQWNIVCDDITKLRYLLVSRNKILQFLESQGLSSDVLMNKSKQIRAKYKDTNTGVFIDKQTGKDYWFYYSGQLAEKPINIVIRRKIYESLANLDGIIEV